MALSPPSTRTSNTPRGTAHHLIVRPSMWAAPTLCFLVCAILVRYQAFTRRVRRDVAALLAHSHPDRNAVITVEMLADLPVPVRRFLIATGVVGTPLVQTVHVKQAGKMRASAKQPWMDLTAEQYYSVCPPGFVWDGTMHLGPVPLARARDRYVNGQGNMLIRAGGLYPIADATGAEIDQGALMRYLQEMTYWFPAALLGDNVSFEPIDDRSARVTLTDCGQRVSGTLYVDEEGRLTDFVAQRYRTVEGGYELDAWSCPVTAYGQLAGLELPVRGKAVWKLPDCDLTYIDLSITALDYNVAEVSS